MFDQVLNLFGDSSSLPGFIFNFIIKNEQRLYDHQSKFVDSFLYEMQEHHNQSHGDLIESIDAFFVCAIKSNSGLLRQR